MCCVHIYHTHYTDDSQIWSHDHYPLRREMRSGLGRHSQGSLLGCRRRKTDVFSGAWGSDGVKREQSWGGLGWALLPLPTPVPVQPSPLSCIPAPVTALLCLFTSNTEYTSSLRGAAYAILKLDKGQGAYSKMEQGGKAWEPLLCRTGNKITKMQLLKQTQIILLSRSESPQQEK